MADEREAAENESDLEQQQDPRGDLLKARPGGETKIVEPNPNSGYRDMKGESGFSGTGSESGHEAGAGQ